MTTDGEEPVTSVEEPAPSPAPVEPSEQVAETPAPEQAAASSETPAETPAEQEAKLDAETQKNLDTFLAELRKPTEETPPPTDETVTLTKKELEAQIFRERQSERDRTSREEREAQSERDQQLQIRAGYEQQLHTRIHERAKALAETGELPANFADGIAAEYKQTFYGEGYAVASQKFALAALKALDTLDGAKDAPEEVLAPLQRQAKNEAELFGGVLEVAHALGKRSLEGEFEKRVQAEVNKRVPTEVSVQIKKFMIQNRAAQPNGQLPDAVGTAGIITDEELAKHQNDPVWWEANREKYYAQRKK